jgi:hypothetical protein
MPTEWHHKNAFMHSSELVVAGSFQEMAARLVCCDYEGAGAYIGCEGVDMACGMGVYKNMGWIF